MRIINVQQTNYNPKFNGLINLKYPKDGRTVEVTKEVSKEADKVLTLMFSNMTELGYFEGATLIWADDFTKYCNKAAELTGIDAFKMLINFLNKHSHRGHYYPKELGGTYSLSIDNQVKIFHKYI